MIYFNVFGIIIHKMPYDKKWSNFVLTFNKKEFFETIGVTEPSPTVSS
jgi:hypothetical protein